MKYDLVQMIKEAEGIVVASGFGQEHSPYIVEPLVLEVAEQMVKFHESSEPMKDLQCVLVANVMDNTSEKIDINSCIHAVADQAHMYYSGTFDVFAGKVKTGEIKCY